MFTASRKAADLAVSLHVAKVEVGIGEEEVVQLLVLVARNEVEHLRLLLAVRGDDQEDRAVLREPEAQQALVDRNLLLLESEVVRNVRALTLEDLAPSPVERVVIQKVQRRVLPGLLLVVVHFLQRSSTYLDCLSRELSGQEKHENLYLMF